MRGRRVGCVCETEIARWVVVEGSWRGRRCESARCEMLQGLAWRVIVSDIWPLAKLTRSMPACTLRCRLHGCSAVKATIVPFAARIIENAAWKSSTKHSVQNWPEPASDRVIATTRVAFHRRCFLPPSRIRSRRASPPSIGTVVEKCTFTPSRAFISN